MANNFVVVITGLETIQQFDRYKDNIEFNTVRMLNTVARDARTDGQERIMSQINYSSGYLNPAGKRFYVSQKATRARPEARILARGRPTSLARFVTSNPGVGKEGVTVQVETGKSTFLPKAFLLKLPAGSEPIETRFNMGLAVRLRPGETLRNKSTTTRVKSGLYMLYGPSVSQVFIDNAGNGVAKDLEPSVLNHMETEFLRLMEWKKNGR